MEKEELAIQLVGLTCSNCTAKIERDMKKVEELRDAHINLMKQELIVLHTNEQSSESILKKVKEIVHKYEPDVKVLLKKDIVLEDRSSSEASFESELESEMKIKKIRLVLGLAFFLVAILSKDVISYLSYLASYAIFGYDVLLSAIKNIFKGKIFDENFLMSIATIGAIFLGEMAESVFVMLFYQIGEGFQSYAIARSRRSISALLNIRPDFANIVTDLGVEKVSPETVAIGEVILVKAGERIPLDGIIITGSGQLDLSALTGETLPKEVSANDEVYSGTINLNGLLKIRVTKDFSNSTVVKILEMVENASAKKSTTEQFITKFSRIYTPIVVALAVTLAILPPVLGFGDFSMWFGRALIFLVISCPCALVLSVPLGFFSGIGASSKNGILIKGSNYLQILKDVDTIVFDKTGTLTKGVFQVVEVCENDNFNKEEIVRYGAMGEKNSTHPIASAIVKYYEENSQMPSEDVGNFREISGYGITYTLDGKKIMAGNEKLLKTNDVSFATYDGIGSVVYIAVDGIYAGRIIVADELKETTAEAMKNLKAMGIRRLVMLTGDKKLVAEKVGKELGLDEWYSELLPQDKVTILEGLFDKDYKGKILFVGDGINDAPVLARADIGVAMGGIGSDAAIEAADMVIMNDEIGKIKDGIIIARNTNKIVVQNIIFALGVKGVVLIFGALGIASMWLAVFADVGVSFLAILNAMRKKI